MTTKSRLLATAFAISLSTPAAAVTITLGPPQSLYLDGPASFTQGFTLSATYTLSPEPADYLQPGQLGGWEFVVQVEGGTPVGNPDGTPGNFSYIIASGCYRTSPGCIPERGGPPHTFHVGDVVSFSYFTFGDRDFENFRPTLFLDVHLPAALTPPSPVPVPAALPLFSSALLAGWLGWRWRDRARGSAGKLAPAA